MMAKEYRRDAEAVKLRAAEMERRLERERLGETEQLRLRARLALLQSMGRELRATAVYLENYYRGRSKTHGCDEGGHTGFYRVS